MKVVNNPNALESYRVLVVNHVHEMGEICTMKWAIPAVKNESVTSILVKHLAHFMHVIDIYSPGWLGNRTGR